MHEEPTQPSSPRRRYRLNVVGDFYVEDGCCTMCGVPFTNEAPDLFGVDGEEHCYVRRQPTSARELEVMLNAIRGADTKCIRYAGRDAAVLRALAEADELDVSDHSTGSLRAGAGDVA
ncbi:ferredoxin [Enhygromyxa salina]|uniref:Ferredoxin n=1 Tax=Enhygromyxa salina TaxID=215803 RepID=A0A2S9YSP3_9BACT|nr:ferredoxin [Enhygromyxa salina]PRQ08106.1 hypothetical protein ENSA7_20780 [Enhygromyxa salina]